MKIVVSDIPINNPLLKNISFNAMYFIQTAEASKLTLDQYQNLVNESGVNKGLIGYGVNNKKQLVYITGRFANPEFEFKKIKVLAIMTLFNESDVVESVIGHLLEEEVDVHIIDNWSTDGSYTIVENL